MDKFEKTNAEFEAAIAECRDIFSKKLHDYRASWRILRPASLTDQLFIKAKRIRSLEIKQESLVRTSSFIYKLVQALQKLSSMPPQKK